MNDISAGRKLVTHVIHGKWIIFGTIHKRLVCRIFLAFYRVNRFVKGFRKLNLMCIMLILILKKILLSFPENVLTSSPYTYTIKVNILKQTVWVVRKHTKRIALETISRHTKWVAMETIYRHTKCIALGTICFGQTQFWQSNVTRGRYY